MMYLIAPVFMKLLLLSKDKITGSEANCSITNALGGKIFVHCISL